ncbi:unnamed protein product [Merluccius merluccius]
MTLRERLVCDSLMNALANPDLIFLLLTPSEKECKKVEKSEQEVQMLLAELTTLRKLISKKKSLIPEKGVLRPSIRGNLLLENSLKRRFPHSPLFHTQTLTIQGIPVAERLDPLPTFTCPQVASDPEP